MRARPGPLKAAWRRIRTPLANSPAARSAVSWTIAQGLRLVFASNRMVEGSDDAEAVLKMHAPAITALWHGQHLLAPCFRPRDLPATALFSRSADAEMNALVAERFGIETVRGSGGRNPGRSVEKGGARALIALKKALGDGKSVVMIADIPHGEPRQAGLGIITLARLSGRPILPAACATSRRKVIEKSWDRTAVNLPFGRIAVVFGDPLDVPSETDDDGMEACRRELTRRLNAATEKAYALVGDAERRP